MVGDLRTSPAHHQSTAVHMLHLHVNGSAAAYWEEDRELYRKRNEGTGGDEGRTTAEMKVRWVG